MPTLSELATSVYRDLADEQQVVFSQSQVEDFIRHAITELNRVAPIDSYDDLTISSTWTEYQTTISLPYRVEARSTDGSMAPFREPEPGFGSDGGYIFRETATGGVIEVPWFFVQNSDPETTYVRVYGYKRRALPYAALPSPETGLSPEEEYAVRQCAKAQGFELLTHDRGLFQQWQGQTNNTDVSPVMMMNMAAIASRDWDRKRGLIRTVRRYW